MEYTEFANSIMKKGTKREFKVRNSWGVYDSYKAIRKHGWFDIGRPLKEHEFYSIIREVNNLLAEDLALGKEIVFPYRMGKVEVRKMPVGVSLVRGELKNTYPIAWEETIRLWFNDEESMNNKTLVRKEVKEVFYIKYNKFKANYENQSFYEFKLNRFIKLALNRNSSKGKIETLW